MEAGSSKLKFGVKVGNSKKISSTVFISAMAIGVYIEIPQQLHLQKGEQSSGSSLWF